MTNALEQFQSCFEKQKKIITSFQIFSTQEERYQKLIALGKSLSPLSPSDKIPANLVKGCQSQLYLYSFLKTDKIIFLAESEALISAGLAALLISVYSDESPEAVLKCPPLFLDELGIHASLSPSRSNGLSHLHLRMKQDALKLLHEKNKLMIQTLD